MNKNKFDAKNYPGLNTLNLSKLEAEKWYGFKKDELQKTQDKILFKKHTIPDQRAFILKKMYEDRNGSLDNDFLLMKHLGFKIYAPIDFHFEKYLNLKRYKNIEYVFREASDILGHPPIRIMKELLLFIEDEECIELLTEHLFHIKENEEYMKAFSEEEIGMRISLGMS